jgi:hypothetical protein
VIFMFEPAPRGPPPSPCSSKRPVMCFIMSMRLVCAFSCRRRRL